LSTLGSKMSYNAVQLLFRKPQRELRYVKFQAELLDGEDVFM